ncbi:hypothetical protein FBZ98_1011019 [Rhizobium sp. ERR 922]|uniref:DNA replication protein n=1 Tax=unclassified Rhizobium TaxID=2613769 RepID=UPI0011A4E711|nr:MULTISPECIES: DNA replication protein [unclassified Rhizobium]TWB61674.1 hypothetical protein FBZ98_1011019 [Rhizobium sp. ERR 922]TWC04600.1 hypothetical protein FBZ97_1011019 [Rhizobium sp. ERR 942]
MSEIRELIEKLVAAGVDPVEAAEVVSRAAIHGAASAPKARSAGAIRQERYRRNKASHVTESNDGDALSSPSGSSPKPLSPNPHQSIPPSPPKGGSSPAGFDDFWSIYPNKVGKRDAEKSFARALSRATLPEIINGLRRYVAKTDDRPWCNPATWLNQDRWTDAPAAPVPRQQAPPRERTIFDAIDDFTGRHDHELSAGTTIDLDGGDYSPNVHLLAPSTRR